jgi:hypothetical protein
MTWLVKWGGLAFMALYAVRSLGQLVDRLFWWMTP